jgi:PKHD-type hydroxylase
MRQPLYVAEVLPDLIEGIEQYVTLNSKDIEDGLTSNQVKKSVRDNKILWIRDNSITSYIYGLAQVANRNHFGFNISVIPEVQWAQYSQDGHFDWHVDVDWKGPHAYDRKVSISIQLSDSDEYTGGDLEFEDVDFPDKELIRKKGTAIVFPSYIRHRVTPVTSGVRRSLVAWAEGPKWM